MEHLSNDHEDHPIQYKNSHKLYDETDHPVVNFMESQWQLRQQYDRNFPMEGIGKPVHMMDINVSKDKNISRWIDRENLIYVR